MRWCKTIDCACTSLTNLQGKRRAGRDNGMGLKSVSSDAEVVSPPTRPYSKRCMRLVGKVMSMAVQAPGTLEAWTERPIFSQSWRTR